MKKKSIIYWLKISQNFDFFSPRRSSNEFLRCVSRLFFCSLIFSFGGQTIDAFEADQDKKENRLSAAVLEHHDRYTGLAGLATALRQVGYQVKELDFTDSIPENVDLVAIGSFASEHLHYQQWVKDHHHKILKFLDQGGLVLQFTQADQTEPAPQFLPEHLVAVRDDLDADPVFVLHSKHSLTNRLPMETHEERTLPQVLLPAHADRTGSWETFVKQSGFQVLLALAPKARPVLMVGQHGKGRVVLTSLYFDKTHDRDGESTASEAFMDAADFFFQGLHQFNLDVRHGKASPVDATVSWQPAEPFDFVPGSMTIAVLPDTQHYSEKFPHHFHRQTEWIVENRERLNIKAVLHVGDIVNRNTVAEWKNAQSALERLHGQVAIALAPGNHDYGDGGRANRRTTLMNDFIQYELWSKNQGFGGTFEKGQMENHFSTFEHNHVKYIAIALEWSPRDAVLQWANRVLSEHSDHLGILVLHAYMYHDNQRYDWKKFGASQTWNPYSYGTASDPGGVNDGEDVWQKLARKHDNLRFVFSGHVLRSGVGTLSSSGDHGNTVHQMLANYQMRSEGGSGWMRLVQILPDNQTVRVMTYSPSLDRWDTEYHQQFEHELDSKPQK